MGIFTSVHKQRKPGAKEILRASFYRLSQAEGSNSSATRGLSDTYIWGLVPFVIDPGQNGGIYVFKSRTPLMCRFSLSYGSAGEFAGHLLQRLCVQGV